MADVTTKWTSVSQMLPAIDRMPWQLRGISRYRR